MEESCKISVSQLFLLLFLSRGFSVIAFSPSIQGGGERITLITTLLSGVVQYLALTAGLALCRRGTGSSPLIAPGTVFYRVQCALYCLCAMAVAVYTAVSFLSFMAAAVYDYRYGWLVAVTFGAAVPPSAKVSESYFDDALFIGDSITTGITGYGILNNATVLASKGVNPSSLLNNKVERPDGSKENLLDLAKEENPKKIYIHIGANGVAFIGKETFISLYAQSIQRLKEDHPDAIIYVQSIFPVTKAKADAEPLYSNDKIDAYNLAIMEMTKEQEVYYLNVAEVLKGPDGALPNEVSPADGMHFGPATYRVWMDYLLSHVVDAEDYPQESSGVESTPSGSSSESQEPSSSSASG